MMAYRHGDLVSRTRAHTYIKACKRMHTKIVYKYINTHARHKNTYTHKNYIRIRTCIKITNTYVHT